MKIEFRDMSDLGRVILSHFVAPHKPGRMCTALTPSTLLYSDMSKSPREIHCLDLSGSEPQPAAGKPVIHTKQNRIRDICYVKDGDKQLLVVAAKQEGIHAYNTITDRLEWSANGKLPGMGKEMSATGVTTDGRGHLFVADYNGGNICIQMFSTAGQYLGCLIKDEDLGSPARIQWCDETSSILAAFHKNSKWNLNVIHVQ